jgi:Skp family chaperone for outer membrane proteins
MKKSQTPFRLLALGAMMGLLILGGCTKRPSQEELGKLDEARMAAESAEKKLAELKSERAQLEQALQEKQAELAKQEEELNDLKQKMGK